MTVEYKIGRMSLMTTRKSFDSFDLTKWICSLMVIIIHTRPFKNNPIFDFYVTDVLCRIAVPLFFAMSGYLFFRRITFKDGKIERSSDNMGRLIKYVKHLSLIYLAASAFYLLYIIPYWYHIEWWGLHAIKDYAASFLFSGSIYHLWYLVASVYGIILLYILLTFVSIDVMKYLCVVGWVVECLLYSYSWIGTYNIGALSWITSHFSACFDAVFRAIPLMYVGLLCAVHPPKKGIVPPLATTIVVYLIEVSWLFFFSPNEGEYSYILTTPVLAYFMLRWLLSSDFQFKNRQIPKWLRETSLIIYIVHQMAIYLLDIAGMQKGIAYWLSVTLLSIAFSIAFSAVKNKLRPNLRKKSI